MRYVIWGLAIASSTSISATYRARCRASTSGFIDESNVDTLAEVRTLHEVSFGGFLITDHVPALVDDTGWGHRGRAYVIGYIRALIDVVRRA